MPRRLVFLCLLWSVGATAAEPAYRLETVEKSAAPEEVAAPIRATLGETCWRVSDGEGRLHAELWLRKQLPGEATDAQIKNGLTYEEVPETTLLGVVRFPAAVTDYRKQRVPAGVYTLRLAHQPQVGDHAGTAPYSTFALALRAGDDRAVDIDSVEQMRELSANVPEGHPSPWLLFPGGKDAAGPPKLVDRGKGHWVVFWKQDLRVGDKPAALGIGLTLAGVSPAR